MLQSSYKDVSKLIVQYIRYGLIILLYTALTIKGSATPQTSALSVALGRL